MKTKTEHYFACAPTTLYRDTADINLRLVHGAKDTSVSINQAKNYYAESGPFLYVTS